MMKGNVCERCNEKSNTFICSIFNVQMICMSCKEQETKHPRYNDAVKKEYEELLKGNYNYEGLAVEEGFSIS